MKKITSLIFSTLLLYSCYSQDHQNSLESEEYVEGIWKITDWTIIDNNLDKEEKENMDKILSGATLHFSDDHVFTSSNPIVFGHLENKKFKIEYEGTSLNFYDETKPDEVNYIDIINRDNQVFFLFISNMVFEIEKIKNFAAKKTFIAPYIQKNSNEIGKNTAIAKVYPIEKIDIPPKNIICIGYETEYQKECLISSIKDSLEYFINYSLVDNKVKIDVSFVIDKDGNLQNLKIISDTKVFDPDIRKGIMDLPKFEPGKKDNQTVNTHIRLQLQFTSSEITQ